jgi:hypothetical protein
MRNGRRVLAAGVVTFVAALVVVSSAAATVRKISFTSRVVRGHQASLTVKVAPIARCSITVIYGNTVSNAFGLSAKRGGTITWRWRVGRERRFVGRWPVKVDCGKSGRRIFYLRVVE